MQRLLWALLTLFFWTAPQAFAQDPVADRAIAAAKEYVKSKNLKEPKLTILLSSLYNNSFPDFTKKWEELTGIKFEIVPLGYTDIPAKIMQEGVAKTGVYDIFNDFPYTMPDAAGAKVVIPVHYATFPALAGTPAQLEAATDAQVVALEPGETWEA